MSVLAERRMHRHSDEVVAAVAVAAVAELRRQEAGEGAWQPDPGLVEAVHQLRSGVSLRVQYEAAHGAGDPPYSELPDDRRDEDELLWLITQALTRSR
jgi:hypothetical protein